MILSVIESFVLNFVLLLICVINLTAMYLLCGLFDRVFIDWYWVGHTKAWLISGTEDLMPYIHKKTWLKKIIVTVIGYPLLAALISWIFTLIMK